MGHSKVFGSILLLVGTSIGAGILALPMVSAASGLLMSTLLMLGMWLLTTVTALLALEINLTFPAHECTFGSMAHKTLGRSWQIATWVSVLFLFYALLAAYASGGSDLLKSLAFSGLDISLPSWGGTVAFMFILGAVVFWSTKATDYTNRFLISFKGMFLIASIFLLLPYIDTKYIIAHEQVHNFNYLGAAVPIFLTAFGFHGSIPSIRIYVGDNRKSLWIIMISASAIPLIIYLLWLLGTLGTVPLAGAENSFEVIKAKGNSVGELVAAISAIAKNRWVTSAIGGFSSISMTTSFLGVSIGLFDFLADGFKRPNTRSGRFQTTILTFFVPLIFALYYPRGFVIALGYAAIFLSFLAVLLPAVMAFKIRKRVKFIAGNKFLFNRALLLTIALIGLSIIGLQLLVAFNLIPS